MSVETARQPAGVPTGGQFATGTRTEAAVQLAAVPPAPPVLLTVPLQEWVGDTAYPVDDQFRVDVTDLVSRLTPEQVAALKDDDDTADDLFLRAIDEGLTEHHNGPFSVQVEASLLEHQIAINPVDGLTALAVKLKVDPSDLDDAVRDVTDTMASTMVNTDPADVPVEDSQDRHYGDMDRYASSVNNGGIHAQVVFLVDQVGAERTEELLAEALCCGHTVAAHRGPLGCNLCGCAARPLVAHLVAA